MQLKSETGGWPKLIALYFTLFVIFGGLVYSILNHKSRVDFLEFITSGTVYTIILITVINQLTKDFFNLDLDNVVRINFVIFISTIILILKYQVPQIVINKNTAKVFFFTLLSLTLCIPIILNHFTNNPKIQDNHFSYQSDILQFSIISDSLIRLGILDNQILPGSKMSYYWLIFSHVGFTSHITKIDTINLHSLYYPIILLIIFIFTFIKYVMEFSKNSKFIIINLISLFVGGMISISNRSNYLDLISMSNIFGLTILLNILIVTKNYLKNPSKLYFLNFILLLIGLNLTKTPMIITLLLSFNLIFLFKSIKQRHVDKKLLALCLPLNLTFILSYYLIFKDASIANRLHFGNGFAETLFNSPYYVISAESFLTSAMIFFAGVMLIFLKLPGLFLVNLSTFSKSLIFSIISLNFLIGLFISGLLYHSGGGNMHFLLSSVIPIIPLSSKLISSKFRFGFLNWKFGFYSATFFIVYLIWLFLSKNYNLFLYQTDWSYSNFSTLAQLGISILMPCIILLMIFFISKQDFNKIVIHLFALSIFIGLFQQLKFEGLLLNSLAKKYNWYSSNSLPNYYDSANGVTVNHLKSFDWIQKNTHKNSIFITNRFCARKISPPKLTPPSCQGDTFVLSAFSKRKVFIEGYRSESNAFEQVPDIVSDRVGISVKSIEQPTVNSISDLKNRGIYWLYIDKAYSYNRNVDFFGNKRYENDSVLILSLK